MKFDLRDDPNGGTYILIWASYLKQRENDGIPLTQEEQISARRFSRSFPIMCVVSFLDKLSSVDFYASLRSQLIDSVGASKLSSFKPQLVDRWILCSRMLAVNNGGQDIKSLVEAIGSEYKAKLECAEGLSLDNEDGMKRIINYLKEELLRWGLIEFLK